MEGFKIKCNVSNNHNYKYNQSQQSFVKRGNSVDVRMGLNANQSLKQSLNQSFNIRQSFNQVSPLWQQKNEKVYRKPLLPWVASLSLVIFALSFVNSRAKEDVNFDDASNKTAGNYLEFDLNRNDSGIFANDVKNIGIGTSDPKYKLEVSGSVILEDSAVPSPSNGHSGVYSNKGELYTMDASGNSVKISSHNENGLWQYNSKNVNTGKELEVEMELLTKELNRMLGGGYITENGKIIDQGENTLDQLKLQTEKNINTLGELQVSVDKNLNIINKEINQFDDIAKELEDSINDVKKDANQQADLISRIRDKVSDLESENESLLDFFLAINPNTLVYLEENGDLNLDGLVSAREISVGVVRTEKLSLVSTDFSQSLGTATILVGETEVFIENTSIEESDRVFITPNSPMKQTIAATEVRAGEGFMVSMVESLNDDISFDWFIVNEVDNKSEIVVDEIQ